MDIVLKKIGKPMFSSCYINPTPNDRNLEYDQESNLVPDDYVKGATFPP